MNEMIKKRFTELKITGQRSAILPREKYEKDLQLIQYLKTLIVSKEVSEFEDVGFCYWNISDSYALTKDGYSLMCNHKDFYNHIKTGNKCYLYWLVCDATQRLTLEKDGFSDFWWSLYCDAIEKNIGYDNFFAEFNTHRAALYANPILLHKTHRLEYAKANFENFLQKAKNTSEYTFYKIIYFSIISRFCSIDMIELKALCESLFDGLLKPKTANIFLVGEWQSFVTPFDINKQSVVGITSAINAFIYCGELQVAKEMYKNACDLGLPKNRFIEKRLK